MLDDKTILGRGRVSIIIHLAIHEDVLREKLTRLNSEPTKDESAIKKIQAGMSQIKAGWERIPRTVKVM